MRRLSRKCILILGLIMASGVCAPIFTWPLAAQQSVAATFATPGLSSLSSGEDVSALPDAPVPNIPPAASTAARRENSELAAPSATSIPSDLSEAGDPVNTETVAPTTFPFHERLTIYLHSFTTPESLIAPLMGAGISQAEGTPREWGGGMEGFGRRLASSYGRNAISRTIMLGVATLDHEDPRYHPSDQKGFWPRTRHAIVATFVSPTTSGGSEPAYSRFAGAYGAAFIANAWEPPSENSARHALERGSISLVSSIGWNVFKEFWPSIRGPIHLGRN
jgi:hypothetical protein